MSTALPSVPAHRPLAVPAMVFLGLTAASIALLVISSILAGVSLAPLTSPLQWLTALEAGDAAETVGNAAEVVAAVLAVAVTVVAIVVELAANRYSHEITRLFLREPVNLIILGLFVITTLQCIWTALLVEDGVANAFLPHAGFAITLGLVTLCLLLLVPYIYFVFTFLSPISVIQRICRDAYRVILRVSHRNVPGSQAQVEEAVDELQDVARSAITQGDRSIAMAAVDSLAGLVMDYYRVRQRLPAEWFRISHSIAADPDFVALAPEVIEEVQQQGMWLERKVFRRYLSLMGQSAGHARDVANVIGINTQRIAVELGPGEPHLLDLCQRAFNSYLRVTMNARDPRTAYFLMNQYRLMGERLMRAGHPDETIRVAGYLKEYGQIAHNMGLSFLLETAAHDVMQLIHHAVEEQSPAVDELLTCLLELDQEIKEDGQEESLLGVRRAQIQLATVFLQHGDQARTRRIVADLRGERMERLERLRQGMQSDDRAQFWELMDRGVNFGYLDPARRPYLAELFEQLNAPAG